MELSSKFTEIAPAVRAGLDNLEKWYRKTDKTDAYFICLGTYLFILQKYNPYPHDVASSIGSKRQVSLC